MKNPKPLTAEMQRAMAQMQFVALHRLEDGTWGFGYEISPWYHAITIRALVNRGLARYTKFERVRSRANRPVEVRLK